VNATEVLRSLPLLSGLPDDEIANMAALAEPFELEPGVTLFAEGDPAEAVFVVASGRVESLKRLPGDRAVTATEQGPGSVFGTMALIAGLPRLAEVRAIESTRGLVLDARAVQGLLGRPGTREVGRRLAAEALTLLRNLVERLTLAVDADPHAVEAPPAPAGPPPPVVAVDPEPGETAYLETLLFLGEFDAPQLERLFGGLRRLSAPRGASLVAEGDRPEALLIVLRGAVESTVRRGGAAGRVRLSGPGRVVTHLGVLDEEPSPVSCRARERSILLEVPREHLAALTAADDLVVRRFFQGLYRDVVDAILHADRPLSRMAAARP
jgi:CRP-like cAMP-binding protein